MDEKQKRQLAEIHNKELGAEFKTWQYEGKVYHNVGLMQMWVRGYTPYERRFEEPPVITDELRAWIDAHGIRLVDFAVGPPAFEFPNDDVAQLFKLEWHDKARERYPYEHRAKFKRLNQDSALSKALEELGIEINNSEKGDTDV